MKKGATKTASKETAPAKTNVKPKTTKALAAPAERKRKVESKKLKETPEPTVNGRKQSVASSSSNTTAKKRKAEDAAPSTAAAKKPRTVKSKVAINDPPTQRLHVFNFGTGDTGGELGLGPDVRIVKRPRLNPLLPAESVGIVQVACGGMHCAALSHDNRIYTWGVNDHGALGRDTKWEGGMRDLDGSESDEDSDEAEMNPYESKPTPIDEKCFPEGTVFTQLTCCDSSTFALTNEGLVYGWGTFKVRVLSLLFQLSC